jgi:hypothetical protein
MFLTFIYAAALDIVLTHYLLKSSHSFWGILALLIFVVLLASDWSSKARARIIFHESPNYSNESLNSIWVFAAELAMVFSLIVGSSYLLEHHFDSSHGVSESKGIIIAYVAAGVFACLSHIWDIILIRAANNRWTRIISAFLTGTLEKQEWYVKYLPQLLPNRDRGIAKLKILKDSANNELGSVLKQWSQNPTQISNFFRWLRIYFRFLLRFLIQGILFQVYRVSIGWVQGSYSAASYFAAFHVLVSNLVFSILIFHHFLAVQHVDNFWIASFRSVSAGTIYIEHPLIAIIMLVGFIIFLPIAHWLVNKKAPVVLLTSIIWVILVSMLPALGVIIVLIIQQVLVTLFFHRFSLSSRANDRREGLNASCAFE